MGYKVSSGNKEKVLKLTNNFKYSKNYCIKHFKWVNWMACEFHLDKVVKLYLSICIFFC